jgi:hypothetical protein
VTTPRLAKVGRLRAVLLSEVPLRVRERAGRRLVDQAALDMDLWFAAEVHRAVYTPSDRIHWVDAQEAERVLGNSNGQKR